jgi:sugar lactone lactonase YvrE
MTRELNIACEAGAHLGEGPCWDERESLLYWIDGLGKAVHVFDPATGRDRETRMDQFVGCVVLREKGGCLLALQNGLYFFDTKTGAVRLIVNPEAGITGNRFNDGKCDSRGRLWFGSMSLAENEGTGTSEPAGSFYCIEPDLRVRTLFTHVGISNGIGWSPDEKTMYYIDSPTRNVDAFDFDAATGSICNRRHVVTFQKAEGIPDGMCVDIEGMLWVAQWGGGQVSRWDPRTARMIDHIPVPVPNVTCCAFAGERGEEMYITTSTVGITESNRGDYPHAGALFMLRPGTRGATVYRFKG